MNSDGVVVVQPGQSAAHYQHNYTVDGHENELQSVTSQIQLMPQPAMIPECPPGLEYLTQVDQLLAFQAVEIIELLSNFEGRNKFKIQNTVGQQVYYAAEESGCCMRNCCGASRGFVMHITDNYGTEVMRAVREFKCGAACCGCCWCVCHDCCAWELRVEAPVGTVIGNIKHQCSFCRPLFEIQDEHFETILNIRGPLCVCDCYCSDPEFHLLNLEGYEVGSITRRWSGCCKQCFTNARNYSIKFPMDMHVKTKATLLAAVFLLNMMYFELPQGAK